MRTFVSCHANGVDVVFRGQERGKSTCLVKIEYIRYLEIVCILFEKVSIMVSYYNIVGILTLWLKLSNINGYRSGLAMRRYICKT